MANGNSDLTTAKRNKKDGFYTQITYNKQELRHCHKQFKGKVVYCDCDVPHISAFFEYFTEDFEFLGLKRLFTTCFKRQRIDLFSLNDSA